MCNVSIKGWVQKLTDQEDNWPVNPNLQEPMLRDEKEGGTPKHPSLHQVGN